ncbi:DUF4825 domain-containing protein [Alicyclobacillus tolerans]|uniref:DUF4825 domain-containing protein n=1 Tax=Alicyclobacillus tolerans TaxID=90970 RepID=UPI001F3BE856|nr:DUF4825 domain-containing protein [Alicyclobacillus tolerans]MCF8567364.1 DUF4825 domain-containing protein [Alicyclobacillus tolerans]
MAIIVLVIVGVVALCFIEFGVKAKIRHRQQQYATAQLNPQTNDFKNIVKFKSPYMGNNSNDENLNANLPFANVPHTFLIHPTAHELDIRYTESVQDLGMAMSQFQASLVYDATANLALIDNLNAITFTFSGASYHTTRARVESWYGVTAGKLTNASTWQQDVQSKLSDLKYATNAFQTFFGQTN